MLLKLEIGCTSCSIFTDGIELDEILVQSNSGVIFCSKIRGGLFSPIPKMSAMHTKLLLAAPALYCVRRNKWEK